MQELKSKNEDDLAVDGELVADDAREDLAANKAADIVVVSKKVTKSSSQKTTRVYLGLPVIFITVALMGGLRLSGLDSSFVFLKPPLLCLIFAAILLALFFRSGLIRVDGWFSEDFSMLKNIGNGAILVTLFAAATQIFNSLLPEQGLPFWVVGFCFFWTLWNNLFADFDTKKLLRSLGALFGLAFVAKYLVLANLAAPDGRTWFERLTENPGQEAMTWLLDLPRFAPVTGYIQFFAAALFLVGLFLLPATTNDDTDSRL
jgi:hypothetical protein